MRVSFIIYCRKYPEVKREDIYTEGGNENGKTAHSTYGMEQLGLLRRSRD